MKKFLKVLGFLLVLVGTVKLVLTILPNVDNDEESISTANREYITL